MVSTFLGNMPAQPTIPGMNDISKSLRLAGAAAAPEVGLPDMIASRLGFLAPAANLATRAGANAGVIGVSGTQLDQPNYFQNLLSNTEKAAPFTLGMEGLTVPFRAASSFSELTNPIQYSADKTQQIQDQYSNFKNTEKNLYQPVMSQYGSQDMGVPANYISNFDEYQPYIKGNLKRLNDQFMDAPTFDNAHKLQSQMFSRIQKLSANPMPDADTLDQIDNLSNARSDLKNDFIDNLRAADPNAANQYQAASNFHLNNVAPYLSNPLLAQAAKGDIGALSPNELEKALSNVSGSSDVLQGHPLSQMLQDVQTRMAKGQALGKILSATPAAMGGIAGYFAGDEMGHPWVGAGTGLGEGLMAMKAPMAAERLAQNPWVAQNINRLKDVYFGTGKGILANNSQP